MRRLGPHDIVDLDHLREGKDPVTRVCIHCKKPKPWPRFRAVEPAHVPGGGLECAYCREQRTKERRGWRTGEHGP